MVARDTVNLAIGMFRARLAEGHVNNDTELVRHMTAEIQRAERTLDSLDQADATQVGEVRKRYQELVRATPEVPTEVLDRYERELGKYGDRSEEDIFPSAAPDEFW